MNIIFQKLKKMIIAKNLLAMKTNLSKVKCRCCNKKFKPTMEMIEASIKDICFPCSVAPGIIQILEESYKVKIKPHKNHKLCGYPYP